MRLISTPPKREGEGCSEFRVSGFPVVWRRGLAGEGAMPVFFATAYGLVASNSRLVIGDFQLEGGKKQKRRCPSVRVWRPFLSRSLVEEMRSYHIGMRYHSPEEVELDWRLATAEPPAFVIIPLGVPASGPNKLHFFNYHSAHPLSLDGSYKGPIWKKRLRTEGTRVLQSASQKLERIVRPHKLKQKRTMDESDRRVAVAVLSRFGVNFFTRTFRRRRYMHASIRFPGLPIFHTSIEFADRVGTCECRRIPGSPMNRTLWITVVDSKTTDYRYSDRVSLEALARMMREINQERRCNGRHSIG